MNAVCLSRKLVRNGLDGPVLLGLSSERVLRFYQEGSKVMVDLDSILEIAHQCDIWGRVLD